MKPCFFVWSLRLSIAAIAALVLFTVPAFATVNLVLTQGVSSAQPIAIVPFSGQDKALDAPNNIAGIISADLKNSGRFKPLALEKMTQFPATISQVNFADWQQTGIDSLVIGQVQALGDNRYKVEFTLLEVFNSNAGSNGQPNQVLERGSYTVAGTELRRLAHHISDLIYQRLLGEKGIFSTRIAYVVVQRAANQPARYILEVADADGYGPRPLLTSAEPIMSPAWSRDGKQIAYVSFENKRAQIFAANVATGERRVLSNFPGINGAPAWSPDSTKLALVLSKEQKPKIYVLDLTSGALRQVTQGEAIDTEPSWAVDGQSLIFTSDRGGSPQIYRVNLTTGKIERVTYQGEYNARASFAPDGKSIVMLHRERGMYNIASQDLETGSVQILTHSGRDESPSVAPNGSMVIHGSEYGILGLVSADGRVKAKLPARQGKVQDPAWSPFLS